MSAWREKPFHNETARAGNRLVYDLCDKKLIVLVVAIGKREGSMVCKAVMGRRPELRSCSLPLYIKLSSLPTLLEPLGQDA